LRYAYAGYAPQYVRFGVGRMLEAPEALLRIPDLLRESIPAADTARRLVQPISPEALSEVLCQPPAGGLQPISGRPVSGKSVLAGGRPRA
jgi:hypothetical protein